ncbi:hypothetical protein [uncultured Parasphingorhabdus sp.]|uniref:hypothetical protein n=1 Tax=uncultured Parasphingorhabdus sp. TaxID=2709694 RepID=UPI0030D9B773
MTIVSKSFGFAITAYLVTPILAGAPAYASQSDSSLETASAVPGSSCGWRTVKRKNGSTALELDREKWLSKACESDRVKYRIVPTFVGAQSNRIHVGCDYGIFTTDSSDSSLNAQRRTDDLNRQCLSETARMKQKLEDQKALYLEKRKAVDVAQSQAEDAHKTVVNAQREMKAVYDEAMAAHMAKNWPFYYKKLEEYDHKKLQHLAAERDYSRLIAAYEGLIARLA